MLCSDGLTGHVRDEEIAEIVTSEADVESICDQLVNLANSRGGKDDVTVVAAHVEKKSLTSIRIDYRSNRFLSFARRRSTDFVWI